MTEKIFTITVDDRCRSVFGNSSYPEESRGGMILTSRIGAQNFRLRKSEPGYQSDWHVAGDATFIIIRKGILRIELRNGEFRDFHPGDVFIAADYLPEGVSFDEQIHGHRAEVIGEQLLEAVHIKLSKWPAG